MICPYIGSTQACKPTNDQMGFLGSDSTDLSIYTFVGLENVHLKNDVLKPTYEQDTSRCHPLFLEYASSFHLEANKLCSQLRLPI